MGVHPCNTNRNHGSLVSGIVHMIYRIDCLSVQLGSWIPDRALRADALRLIGQQAGQKRPGNASLLEPPSACAQP